MASAAPARSLLIEAHMPLVRTLALRFARRGEPLEDLIQAGAIGLIHAVDRYDPSRGHSFEAYAVPTIMGEIRRHLRDSSAPVRIPRRAYEEHAHVRRVLGELEARTGRTPSAAELARAAAVSPLAAATALDPPRIEPLADPDLEGPPTDPIAELHDRLALVSALRALPLRERRILMLRFYAERSQRRIADDVGLSQVHVSRLLRGALAGVRAALEEGGTVAAPVQEA